MSTMEKLKVFDAPRGARIETYVDGWSGNEYTLIGNPNPQSRRREAVAHFGGHRVWLHPDNWCRLVG